MVWRAAPPNPVAEVVEMSEGGRQAAKPDQFPEYLHELELQGEGEIHQQIADLRGDSRPRPQSSTGSTIGSSWSPSSRAIHSRSSWSNRSTSEVVP